MTYFSVAMIPVLAISQGIPSHKPSCMLSLYFPPDPRLPSQLQSVTPLGRNQIILLNDTEKDLLRIAARKRDGRESNRQPVYRQSSAITTTLPGHTLNISYRIATVT